jgi:hypothetical protein
MVFSSRRSGNNDVWMKDLETGKATAVVTGTADVQPRKVTADGSGVIYRTIENQKSLHISGIRWRHAPQALRGLLRVRCFLRRYEDPDLHPAGDTTGNGAARPPGRAGGRTC